MRKLFACLCLVAASSVASADTHLFRANEGFFFTACGHIFAIGTLWPDGTVRWIIKNHIADAEFNDTFANELMDAYEKEGFYFSQREISGSVGLHCPEDDAK